MLNKAALDALVVLAILVLTFAAGWLVKGWKEDAARLKEERSNTAELLASMDAFDRSAQATIQELVQARDDQMKNKREIVRVLTKIEYRDRECFGTDLVGLLNEAAKGTGPAGAAGQVPAKSSAAERRDSR